MKHMNAHRPAGSLLLACLFVAGAWPALAGAQAAPDQTQAQAPQPAAGSASELLPEIVVTAQRRETLLKDTPASIEAFTADRLDAQGIRDVDDLTRVSPGVQFIRTGMTATGNYNDENSDISIRGIDSSAGTSTTGIYIDDTPIQTRHLSFGTLNAFPALFDLDRVEVLRGPQGTLFGSSSEGGAVRFLQPEVSLSNSSAYARIEAATTKDGAPTYEAGAAFGAPIVQGKIGYRISASFRDDGGWVDRDSYNVLGQPTLANPNAPLVLQDTGTVASDTNWSKTTTLRGALKFSVAPETTISPSVYYQKLQLNDTSAYWPALSNPADGQFRSGNAQPNSSLDPFSLWVVKVDSNLGFANLTSNTSYFDRNQSATSDYTQFVNTVFLGTVNPVPGPNRSTPYFTDVQHNFIEEIKLTSNDSKSPLTWVAGLFLAHQLENTTEYIYVQGLGLTTGAGALFPPSVAPGGLVYTQNPFEAIDKQAALYGQVDYKFTETLKATVGLRVSDVTTDGNEYYAGAFLFSPTPAVSTASITEHPVTPKFGLSYTPDSDNLYYATIAKGYRVGGINSGLGQLCALDLSILGLSAAPPTYKSDSLWSYEIGAKNTLLNHHLEIDSSLFYIDWTDIQQNVYLQHCGLQFAANLGKAVSKGLDVAVHWKATSNLLLGLDAGYTDAYYTQTTRVTPAGAPIVTAGDQLALTPWNWNFMAEYTLPGIGKVDPYVHADFQLTTSQRGLAPDQDTNNTNSSDPTIPSLPVTRYLTLRAGGRWDEFDVSLFANNVLNEHPVLVGSRDVVGSELFFQRTWRPRTIGLTGTYRF